MNFLLEVDLLNEQTIIPYITKTSNFDWIYGEEIIKTKLRLMYLEDHKLFHTNFSSIYLAKNIDERLEEYGLSVDDSRLVKILLIMLIEATLEEENTSILVQCLSPIISESSLIELLSWWGMTSDLVYSFIVTRDVTKELRDHIESLGFGSVLDRRIPRELFGIILGHCGEQTGTALLLTCKEAYIHKGKIEWKKEIVGCDYRRKEGDLKPCSVVINYSITLVSVINSALQNNEFSNRELKYIRHHCNHYDLFARLLSYHPHLLDTFAVVVGHRRNSQQRLCSLFRACCLPNKRIARLIEILNL